MDKSACFVGQTVHFTCNGKGRGGHYHVTAVVTKVNSKNALLTEKERSYWPGSRWNWPIADLTSEEEYAAKCARTAAAYKAGGASAVIQALKDEFMV
jgi:hypothetical protein